MSKTITIRLDEKAYQKIADYSRAENRPISNFIETATLRFMKELEFTDDTEVAEILSNESFVRRLKEGSRDAKKKRGKFVY
ncbi:MAG: CopG family transcriptional regulator [Candidatus Omnitrophica bacterium]|nr:CopG family transcriptional regulator [Candidatus Omnitrophota bacterium]